MYDLYEKYYIGISLYQQLQRVFLMMKDMKFYGSATVGERGQIVLPAKLREDFDIKKGDMLVVVGNAETYRIGLVNPEAMSTFLDEMSKQIDTMKSKISKK
jgi:AbrB family looped-hinge helix DNA binding protein